MSRTADKDTIKQLRHNLHDKTYHEFCLQNDLPQSFIAAISRTLRQRPISIWTENCLRECLELKSLYPVIEPCAQCGFTELKTGNHIERIIALIGQEQNKIKQTPRRTRRRNITINSITHERLRAMKPVSTTWDQWLLTLITDSGRKRKITDMNCIHCGQDVAASCTVTSVEYPDGIELPALVCTEIKCFDCGVSKDGYHHPGCFFEVCPRCKNRIYSWACQCFDSNNDDDEEEN